MNKLIKNLNINIETYNNFYRFNRIVDFSKNDFFYDGKNPMYRYGECFSVVNNKYSSPVLLYDIAYKRDGKLYQVLTNIEVCIVKKGFNHFEDNVIKAAEIICIADDLDIKEYVHFMTQKNNLNNYIDKFIKQKKQRVSSVKKLEKINDAWLD